MKALTATALLLALDAVALAKLNPVERTRVALENAELTPVLSELCARTSGRSELCASRITLERRNRRSTLSPADWSRSCSTRRA